MTYQIDKWDERHENSKSRERQLCGFVCVPNAANDLTFSRLMAHPDGAMIYGVFTLLLIVASRQRAPRLGWLTNDGTPGGVAMTAEDFALMWRRPASELMTALQVLSSPEIGWLKALNDGVPAECPPDARAVPAECPPDARAVPAECPPDALERKKEENEGKNPQTPRGGQEDVLPTGWVPTPEQRRINEWFGRRDSTKWGEKEVKAFRKLPSTSDEDWTLLERYYVGPGEDRYPRQDVLTLLNNWLGEIDRARKWTAKKSGVASPTPASHFTTPTGGDFDPMAEFAAMRARRDREDGIRSGQIEPETEEEEALCR